MMRYLTAAIACLLSVSCDYTEVEREIGYKGRARVDPWLAAGRFTARYGYDVTSSHSWREPEWDDAAWFVPASAIGNRAFTRQMEEWVADGGHLVLLIEHASAETNDWGGSGGTVALEPPLLDWFARSGIVYQQDNPKPVGASRVRFDGRSFSVDAASDSSVADSDGKPGVFVSRDYGDGRLTVLTDARVFRNRWIDENDHAALLLALVRHNEHGTSVGFMKGTGLSFWGLLGDHLWPVLVALGAWLVFWLWRNLTRFGPVEAAAAPSELRGYGHHLEALGDFQWRLDRAAGLLVPLRAQVVERGQRLATRTGRRDHDFMQFLADHAGLPRERVHRALAEAAPADSAILTRTTADLQQLLRNLT
jgi:hypothetical protein